MISIVITSPSAYDHNAREILAHLVRIATEGNETDAKIEWGEVKGVMRQPDSGERDNDMRNEGLDEAAAIVLAARTSGEPIDLMHVRDAIQQLKR